MTFDFVVIDASSWLHRCFHSFPPLATQGGTPTGAVTGCMNTLFTQIRDGVLANASAAVAVFDAPGPTFRHRIDATYKRNRKRHDDLRVQFDICKRGFGAFGLATIAVEGVEADDVIAHLIGRLPSDQTAVILSSDKDLTQLVDGYEFEGDMRVAMMDAMGKNRGKIIDAFAVRERWGVLPDEMASLLALMGDATDGVDGVPGIGEKTAAKLLRDYADLEDLLQHVDDLRDQRHRMLLSLHHQAAREAYRLVKLPSPDCPPLDIPLAGFVYSAAKIDPRDVLQFATDYEMHAFADEVRKAWEVPAIAGLEEADLGEFAD